MPNLTLTTSGTTLSGQNFANGGSVSVAVFSDSGSTTPSASITVSNNGAAVTVDKSSVSPGGTGTSNDFTITAPTVTGNYSVSVIQSVKVNNSQVIYSGIVSGTVSSSGGGVTAPTISNVTHNNAAASTVTATVNLSNTGSGGTLQFAQTTGNTAPTNGWQSSSSFTHARGATAYYWARRSTTAVSGSASLTVPGVSYTVTAPASVNEGSAGTMSVSTVGVPNSTTLYWAVQPSADFGTSTGSVSISGNAASFTLTPTSDSVTEGAETATIVLYTDSARTNNVASDSFTINDTSTGGSGGSTGGGSGGSSSYGIEIQSVASSPAAVFGVNFRTSNIQKFSNSTIAAGGSVSFTNIGSDVTDSSKVVVVVDAGWHSSAGTFPVTRSTANGGTVTVSNNRNNSATVKIIIVRIA